MIKEIEIKLKISSEEFNQLVTNMDDFQFERTYGFFTNEYSNMERWIFPRIKEVIKWLERSAYVTVKVKNQNHSNQFFVRDEYEFIVVNIDDAKINEIRGMFFALEYINEHIFEKKRYSLPSANNCEIVVDVLPFWYFIEIEWDESNITKTITQLNLEWNEKINSAYLKLWEVHKRENNLTWECIF